MMTFSGPSEPLTREQASRLAALPLHALTREYPNKPEHVLAGPAEALTPRQLHPAFYGSYDWHSSVHGHWMLVRLLRRFPDLPEAPRIRALLDNHLTVANLKAELQYLEPAHHKGFERPYGWAWLLKLAEELQGYDSNLAANIRPLADGVARRYIDFFPKQLYPIRSGVHSDTAFGLTFALDYARASKDAELEKVLTQRALFYFQNDQDYPARWEPGGDCFLSPALAEADLMRRVLAPGEFPAWFHRFLPDLQFQPAQVTDRSDPKLVHLDGLNLSRAWALRGIARALPERDESRRKLIEMAEAHAQAGLSHVTSGDYAGEHWLASFAVYLLTED